MWIFTKHGFFSAVCARQGAGGHSQLVDPERIMVRGRLKSHLEALKKRFPDLLGDCALVESVGTDYPIRLFVAKSTWARVLAALAEETDYDNFKDHVAEYQEAGDPYNDSLHAVWAIMRRRP